MEKFLAAVMFFLVSHDVYGFPLFPLTGWAHINTRSHKSMVNTGIGRAVGQFLNDYNYLENNVHWMLAVDVFFGNGEYFNATQKMIIKYTVNYIYIYKVLIYYAHFKLT